MSPLIKYQELVPLLKSHEGTLSYQRKTGTFKNGMFLAYKCSMGYDTIGYGHRVLAGEPRSITAEQADAILLQDVAKAINAIESTGIERKSYEKMPKQVQNIVISLIFQLGVNGFSKFVKTIANFNSLNYKGAAQELRKSKMYKQVPNRLNEYIMVLNMVSDA